MRCQGRHALDLALAYREAPHGWEEEHVAAELRGMLLAAKAPDTSLLKTVKTLLELRGWYQLHGAEYVRRVQKQAPRVTGESAEM